LNVRDKKLLEEIASFAGKVKKEVYDNGIVTFAPFYCSNLCVNNCLYYEFRKENDVIRRRLILEDVEKEQRSWWERQAISISKTHRILQ